MTEDPASSAAGPSGDATASDAVDVLVEQFLARLRRGQTVSVEAFASEHPAHAEALRELLPTLLLLEQAKQQRSSTGSGRRVLVLPALQRLGDFRIVREIGRGGMGVVFEAVQESLGRRVALKVLPQSSLLTGNQLERFRREAHIAAQLHHSNIVPVYGSGESDGYHWYAMQYIAGASLERWQKDQPTAGSGVVRERARAVARIGVAAARALHHAHTLGTLHRDIKPANLLLGEDDHLWVTDFGLAKALEGDGLTLSGDLLGTLQYMPPEQLRGEYEVRSEVYALGATLYELATGRPAFAGGNRTELMERIRRERAPSLRSVGRDLPLDLAVIIETAMAREPSDRYRDCEALAADLEAFLQDRPIAARPLSPLGLCWRWCKRNRAVAALLLCTGLAVLGAGITGWVANAWTQRALAGEQAANSGKQRNLILALQALDVVFDSLVGTDPQLAYDGSSGDEDEDGEVAVRTQPVVEAVHVALLQEMLAFYDQFAAENAGNASLQLETARACRRVGTIRARLGTPSDLDEAAKAYQRALDRLAAIGDAGQRETAAVQLAFGKLELRRARVQEGEARLRAAVDLLAAVPTADRAVRLQRAEATFELARVLSLGGGPGGGPGGPGGARRPGPRGGGERPAAPPERFTERLRAGGEMLQQALSLVEGLLAEDGKQPEVRRLQARCLLLRQRRPGDGPGPESAESRRNDRQRATTILQELVAAEPRNPSYRWELAQALFETHGAVRLRPERRPPGGGDGARPQVESVRRSVEALRQAASLVDGLAAEQPSFLDTQALRARTHAALGIACRELMTVTTESEALAQLRSEARVALQLATAIDQRLLAEPGVADVAWLRQFVDHRRRLAALHLDDGDRAAAAAVVSELLAGLEGQIAAVQQQQPEAGLAVPKRVADFADMRVLRPLEELLRRLDDPAGRRRLDELRRRLQR